MFQKRTARVVLVAALCLLAGLSASSDAATFTWTVATGSAANGSGTWNTSNLNWWNGSSAIAWPNNSGGSADIASFTAASPVVSSTVTLDGTLNAGGLIFSTGNYTLTSGTIAMVTSGTISYSTGNTVSIASTITGSNIRLTNTNNAEYWMTLSGSNQLTGTTTLTGFSTNGARVFVKNPAAFGTSAINCTSGGIYLSFTTSGTLANNITIGFDNAFNNRGPLRFDNGLATLTGTITMVGASNSITTNGGGNSGTIAGPIVESGGSRNLVFGGGFYTLSGASTYTGSTTLNAGSITLAGGNDRLPTATTLSLGATSKLVLGGNSQTLARLLTTSGSGSVVGGNATASALVLSIASGTNAFSGQIGGAGANENNLSLRKQGAGVFAMSGTGSFTGATTIDAGVLSITGTQALAGTSGVSIAGGAGLTYTGGAASFGKNITVTSGTGSVTNSGGGLLTLSGTLTKNGTVLRLAGGAFNVTGPIVGSSTNSDLLVAGTSSVTLSTANTYNGPTFVIESSTLAYGITNAIPSNSVVNLGDATTQGTLSMAGFTGAVGGLSFGSAGGTLRMSATSTSSAPLTAASGTMTLTGGTLDLAGSGSTAGLYRVLSAQSVAGSFANITGTNAAYQVISSSTSVDYQQRAVLGAVTVTNPAAAIITGGSAAFTYTVANTALSGGASLSFSAAGLSGVGGSSNGSATASGTSSSISGLVFTGTSFGAGQAGTFTVTAGAGAFGTTTATGTVSVDVYGHGLLSVTSSTLALANTRVGTAVSGSLAAQAASGFRVGLTSGSASGGNVSLSGITNLAAGGSTSIVATLSSAQTAGAVSQAIAYAFGDSGTASGMSGYLATTGTQTITVTGGVYDFARAQFSGTTIDFGIVHRDATVTVQNVAFTNPTVTDASYQDSLDVSASTGNARVTSTGFSGLAAGAASQILAISANTSTAGSLASTLSLTLASKASIASGLSDGTAVTVGGGSIATTGGVFSGNGIWNFNGGGTWGSGASNSWTSAEGVNAAPGMFGASFASTDSATFGSALTSGSATVTLGSANPSLASLAFSTGSGSYRLSGGTLTLNGGTGTGLVTVSAGSHAIDSGIAMATSSVFSVSTGAALTISGIMSGSSAGIQKIGDGLLVLNGANTYGGLTQVSGLGSRLAINGSVAGNVQVGSGAELGGSGVIAGTISGDGLIAPGNSPGILTVQDSITPSASTSFAFEFMKTGDPIWGAATASQNDVLRLSSGTPFTTPLQSSNIVNVYFEVSSLTNGDIFRGGFFSDATSASLDFAASIGSPTYAYYVLGSGSGNHLYNGTGYFTLAEYLAGNSGSGITGVTASVVTVSSANFKGGVVTNGQVTQFVIVPEPDTIIFAGIGIAIAGWSLSKRRHFCRNLNG